MMSKSVFPNLKDAGSRSNELKTIKQVFCTVKRWIFVTTDLACVMPLLAAGAEAAGGQDEDLLRDGVDLAHALVVVDNRHARLSYPQRNRTS